MKKSCFSLFFAFLIFSPFVASQEITLPQQGICAHRGANDGAPENTIPAFLEAVRRGAEQVEMDVRFTRDKQLVILHDATVDRTSNGTGNINTLLLEEVRKLDFGIQKSPQFANTRIPTLDEVLDTLPKNIWINLQVYPQKGEAEELVLATAEVVFRKNRQHQTFLAVGKEMMDIVRQKYPTIQICNMQRRPSTAQYTEETIAWKCEFVQFIGKLIPTPEEVQKLHQAGVKINYCCVNDRKTLEKLQALGIDFPLTDNMPKVGR